MKGGSRRVRTILVDDEDSANRWLAELLSAHPQIEVAGIATTSDQAEQLVRRLRPDLMFLDIEMPGRSGLEFLADTNPQLQVVLVTAHDQYALQAFDLGVSDYLLKPASAERLARTIGRICAAPRPSPEGPRPTEPSRLVVQNAEGVCLFDPGQIEWIEAHENYTCVHLSAGPPQIVRRSLGDWADELDPDRFVRLSRSLIVHLEQISKVIRLSSDECVVQFVNSQAELRLGRTAKRRLRQLLRSPGSADPDDSQF
jgi:two-component system, LytTR family, response regulator